MDLIFLKKKKRGNIFYVYKFWDYKKSRPHKNFFPPFFWGETAILILKVYLTSTIYLSSFKWTLLILKKKKKKLLLLFLLTNVNIIVYMANRIVIWHLFSLCGIILLINFKSKFTHHKFIISQLDQISNTQIKFECPNPQSMILITMI